MTVKRSRGSRFRLRLKKGQARLLRLLGYPLFALAVFVTSLYLSLPIDRLKDRLERELSQEPGPPLPGSGGLGIGLGMDVTIGQLDLHLFPIGASLSEITLRPRRPLSAAVSAEQEPARPKPMFIEGVSVGLPFSMLLGSQKGLELSVQALGGSISGSGGISSENATLRGEIQHLSLARAPILNQFLPLPLVGNLSVQIDLKVPSRKAPLGLGREDLVRHSSGLPPLDYAKATGLVDLKLEQGVLGDGKAKLAVPGDPFLSQGLTFPKLVLGDLTGRVVIDHGRATFSDVHSRSADAEIWVEGYVELRDPLPNSEIRLYLRFAPSAALIQREPTIEIVNSAMAAGKRSDGALGFAITGTFAMPRSHPSKEPPDGISARPGSLGQVGKDVAPALRAPGALPGPAGMRPPGPPPSFVPPRTTTPALAPAAAPAVPPPPANPPPAAVPPPPPALPPAGNPATAPAPPPPVPSFSPNRGDVAPPQVPPSGGHAGAGMPRDNERGPDRESRPPPPDPGDNPPDRGQNPSGQDPPQPE